MRRDLFVADIGKYNDQRVKIFAPNWIRDAMALINQYIPDVINVRVKDKHNKKDKLSLKKPINLVNMAILARNEDQNLDGKMKTELKHPDLKMSVLYAMKDVIRQCVTIGVEKVKLNFQDYSVILIDHIPLDTRSVDNPGRVIMTGTGFEKGLLDDFLFMKNVGEEKKRMNEVERDLSSGRYLLNKGVHVDKKTGTQIKSYVDGYAYEKFIENDFLLICLAINYMDVKKVVLRYPKTFNLDILQTNFTKGIYRAIDKLIKSGKNVSLVGFEFPMLERSHELERLCRDNNLDCTFYNNDEINLDKNYTLAITTKASPHAMIGNNFNCTEGQIVNLLNGKAKRFIPLLNRNIEEVFIEMNHDNKDNSSSKTSSLSSPTDVSMMMHAHHEHVHRSSSQQEATNTDASLSRNTFVKTLSSSPCNVHYQDKSMEQTERCNDFPIQMRCDQSINDIDDQNYQDSGVTIFAPLWVKEGLEHFNNIIKIDRFTVIDCEGRTRSIDKSDKLTLKELVMMARNERANTSGRINLGLYEDFLDYENVLSLKDLVRQCVIIGDDETTHYGGYGSQNRVEQKQKVIVVDLIGLQFQQSYNTGRFVLVNENLRNGPLDELIFNNVVGQPKGRIDNIQMDRSGRYVNHNNYFFDTYAYQKFVANDFALVCLSLTQSRTGPLKLKFLKYGTGFFAGPFGPILDANIMTGIYLGLEQVLPRVRHVIKALEFPFYHFDQRVEQICKEYDVECWFNTDDALKHSDPRLLMATTNCSDPHSVTGNEMNYQSVDAAIAENLWSKANKFSPVINSAISEQFIDLSSEVEQGNFEKAENRIDLSDKNELTVMETVETYKETPV